MALIKLIFELILEALKTYARKSPTYAQRRLRALERERERRAAYIDKWMRDGAGSEKSDKRKP